MDQGECDPSYGQDFVFDVYEKELIIGDIFVRIYNNQSSFPLENGERFCSDLLNFLGSEAEVSELKLLYLYFFFTKQRC